MKVKDATVECHFHPVITELLFVVDKVYNTWGDELIITSGSEHSAKHAITSLHYAIPGCAFDVRTWDATSGRGTVPDSDEQLAGIKAAIAEFCAKRSYPTNWVDIVLESTHIHIEFQPKYQG